MALSCVRSNDNCAYGFQDKKRINVAITRAKQGLIIIGSSSTLKNCPAWHHIILGLRQVNAYRQHGPASVSQHRVAEPSKQGATVHSVAERSPEVKEHGPPDLHENPAAERWEHDLETSWEDLDSDAQQMLVHCTHDLITFFQRPVTKAVHTYLMSLHFHTKSYIDAECDRTGDKIDIKAWSRQGCNLRALTSLDATNAVYALTWECARTLMAVIEAKAGATAHRQLANIVRTTCTRFPGLLGNNQEQQGDIVEAFLGLLRPWDMQSVRDLQMGKKWNPEDYQNAADNLERCIWQASKMCTPWIPLLADAYNTAFPEDQYIPDTSGEWDAVAAKRSNEDMDEEMANDHCVAKGDGSDTHRLAEREGNDAHRVAEGGQEADLSEGTPAQDHFAGQEEQIAKMMTSMMEIHFLA